MRHGHGNIENKDLHGPQNDIIKARFVVILTHLHTLAHNIGMCYIISMNKILAADFCLCPCHTGHLYATHHFPSPPPFTAVDKTPVILCCEHGIFGLFSGSLVGMYFLPILPSISMEGTCLLPFMYVAGWAVLVLWTS